jgi:hypothetical protein
VLLWVFRRIVVSLLLLRTSVSHTLQSVTFLRISSSKSSQQRPRLAQMAVTFKITITGYTEQRCCGKAKRFLSSQETRRILWTQRAPCHIRKSPPPVPILILINPLHAFTSHSLKIHFNIILPYYYSLLFHLNNTRVFSEEYRS